MKDRGTYALVMALDTDLHLRIGKLGIYNFPPGYYLYVGSALGGLSGRLSRHLRSEKKLHWHIDYLLKYAAVEQIWYATGPDRPECKWNVIIRSLPGAKPFIAGFGASDCRCSSHLIHFRVMPPVGLMKQSLEQNNLPQVHLLNKSDVRDMRLDCVITGVV